MKIHIYSRLVSPRLKYTCDLVFRDLMGVDCEIITNSEEVYTKEFVINYSSQESIGLQILPSKLLFQKRIFDTSPKVGEIDDMKTIFHNGHQEIGFDVLSAVFFMVSRYEEYLPHKTDQHDRFDPAESIAFKNNFLEEPIVNIWVKFLKDKLIKKYPKLKFDTRSYSYINTIDVDYSYAFLEKGLIRTGGAMLRDFFTGKWDVFSKRLSALTGNQKDPFDTFDYVLELHKKHDLESVFFFHVGDYDVNDKSIPIESYKQQSLIKKVNDYASIGVHPSYASHLDQTKVEIEIQRLAKVVHQPITQSRNHFIKFSLPHSYRQLIELGIERDYTMGYASHMGFRAGICNPFYFYDLDYDEPTNLKVYPFYLMEATIKYYFQQDFNQAPPYFKDYIDKVKAHNGTFVSLWHNDSLSNWGQWKGWKQVYEEMVEYALP